MHIKGEQRKAAFLSSANTTGDCLHSMHLRGLLFSVPAGSGLLA